MNATQTSTTGPELPATNTRTGSATPASAPSPLTDDSAASHAQTDRIPEPPAPALSSVRQPRARQFRSALAGIAVLAFTGYLAARYLAYAHSWVSTDNAFVAGHIHSISPRVAGTVKEVLVDENKIVSAGAVLARLDPADFEVHRQQAVAQLTQARAQVQGAQASIAVANAQIAREQARATKARGDLARANALFEGGSGAISKQELELAKAESEAAEAALQGARSALESATASALASQAQEQAAQAGLHDAELQLSYTALVAPSAGQIGKKNLEVGNRVQPGQALLALVEPDVWVTANFKETQLANLKPGQPVRIKADVFPGRTFRGTIDSVSPASGAQFALLPPDNATGNFTKIVQRVPVKILLDSSSLGEFAGRLVTGMSVVVEVKVHD